MSRTDLDPVTIARSLRRMAGDGSIEWVMEPMQASVLLDVADMLDENAKLRELVRHIYTCMVNIDMDGNHECYSCEYENANGGCDYEAQLNELGIEV